MGSWAARPCGRKDCCKSGTADFSRMRMRCIGPWFSDQLRPPPLTAEVEIPVVKDP